MVVVDGARVTAIRTIPKRTISFTKCVRLLVSYVCMSLSLCVSVYVSAIGLLHQGWPNYDPRATSGPQNNFIWPSSAWHDDYYYYYISVGLKTYVI